MLKVTLPKEEVIHFTHYVIQTVQCEWEGCALTLNSWDSLAKHLFRHCSRVALQDGTYRCSYSRCSGRLHSSSAALKTHMELSHLSRVALRCPARSCGEVFTRVQQLPGHVEDAHKELLDAPVSLDAFAPLTLPLPPRRLRRPPPLPRHKIRMSSFLPSVSMPPVPRGPSQASASKSISRRWSRLNVQDQESESQHSATLFEDLPRKLSAPKSLLGRWSRLNVRNQESESGRSYILFEDLPRNIRDMIEPPLVDSEVEVRKKVPFTRQPHLSRPQPSVYPPPRPKDLDQTILYSAFKPMVDKLVANGTLAGRKE